MTATAEQYAADLLDPPAWQPPNRKPPLPHQIPPAGTDWMLWLLEAGRDAGKTEACSRYFAAWMRMHPGHRGRIIGPTFGDAVQSCIKGPSGLLSVDPEVRWHPASAGGATVSWPNGSEAVVIGTPRQEDVERLRALGGRHLDWWEEMAANAKLAEAWTQAELGLREGDWPHSIASTTPRPTAAYKRVRDLPGVVRTHATSHDNPYAPEVYRQRLLDRYGGTRLGRQEVEGLLLEDSDRALVRREWIESCRVDGEPAGLVRLNSVGLDPGGERAQALVLVGHGLDGFFYVKRSEMVDASATDFLRHAIRVANANDAILIVEKNHGGDYLLDLLNQVMRELGVVVGVKVVWASAGKRTRAEPVGLLIEQGKVKWVGPHAQLEDEWCATDWDQESPHLADAMVWATTSLMGSSTVGHELDLEAVPFQ